MYPLKKRQMYICITQIDLKDCLWLVFISIFWAKFNLLLYSWIVIDCWWCNRILSMLVVGNNSSIGGYCFACLIWKCWLVYCTPRGWGCLIFFFALSDWLVRSCIICFYCLWKFMYASTCSCGRSYESALLCLQNMSTFFVTRSFRHIL
jgi:hypothetical protein